MAIKVIKDRSGNTSSKATTRGSLSNRLLTQSESAAMDSTMIGLRSEPMVNVWNRLVPTYKSRNYGPTSFQMDWNPYYATRIEKISPKRTENRIKGYLSKEEILRVKKKLESKGEASLRFGALKTGQGYSGERGDYCLVGGVVKGKLRAELTLFYRSLEMIGGFAYDLTLIRALEIALKVRLTTVTIYTCKAFVFALRGNSNEKLFPKLQEIFG